MNMSGWKQHWTLHLCYYGIEHIPHCRPTAAARTHCVMATFGHSMNVESTTRLWQRTPRLSLHLRLSSLLSRLLTPGTWCHLFKPECLSMATLVYAHGTNVTILTPGLVAERIFLCHPGKDTDYNKRNFHLKNIFFTLKHYYTTLE